MPDKLTPLTPKQQEEFNNRRESKAVVQTRCEQCGAWWETNKRNSLFTEKFMCKCGNLMEFKVPPLETTGLIKPDNSDILAVTNSDLKLDTGMSTQEAIQRAAQWWQRVGAAEMRTQQKRQAKPVGGADNGAGAAFADADSTSNNFLPSNIIHGLPWDSLNKREKLSIVKIWHHFYIRKPDLLGEDASAQHKLQDRNTIH